MGAKVKFFSRFFKIGLIIKDHWVEEPSTTINYPQSVYNQQQLMDSIQDNLLLLGNQMKV